MSLFYYLSYLEVSLLYVFISSPFVLRSIDTLCHYFISFRLYKYRYSMLSYNRLSSLQVPILYVINLSPFILTIVDTFVIILSRFVLTSVHTICHDCIAFPLHKCRYSMSLCYRFSSFQVCILYVTCFLCFALKSVDTLCNYFIAFRFHKCRYSTSLLYRLSH